MHSLIASLRVAPPRTKPPTHTHSTLDSGPPQEPRSEYSNTPFGGSGLLIGPLSPDLDDSPPCGGYPDLHAPSCWLSMISKQICWGCHAFFGYLPADEFHVLAALILISLLSMVSVRSPTPQQTNQQFARGPHCPSSSRQPPCPRTVVIQETVRFLKRLVQVTSHQRANSAGTGRRGGSFC